MLLGFEAVYIIHVWEVVSNQFSGLEAGLRSSVKVIVMLSLQDSYICYKLGELSLWSGNSQ